MNVYLRNIIIAIIANIVVFLIGWGCIVPDVINDQTHLFGLIGDVEILRGNTSTVFGVCSIMSTLVMIVGMVEALVEDCRPRSVSRKPLPTGTFHVNREKSKDPKISRMRIDPSPDEDPCPEKGEKICDEDPKTPTLD